jgi:hypothetical protein
MNIIDRFKIARNAALAHEQAAHDLRVAAFANYQAAGRSDDAGDYTLFEAARSAHIAACEALRSLETTLEKIDAIENAKADLQRLIDALNS